MWLEGRGYAVDAFDVSTLAVANALGKYPQSGVAWRVADALSFVPEHSPDLTVAYGIAHCLRESDIAELIERVTQWTAADGCFILVAFNDRSQDLEHAHPGFRPTLLPHAAYLEALSAWEIVYSADDDLHEAHPHNQIEHHHSMTRIIARRRR